MKGNKTELSFICIGFQKCGTTSLYDLLKQHSDIYLTEDVKEPMFYRVPFVRQILGRDWYRHRYFGHLEEAGRMAPDARRRDSENVGLLTGRRGSAAAAGVSAAGSSATEEDSAAAQKKSSPASAPAQTDVSSVWKPEAEVFVSRSSDGQPSPLYPGEINAGLGFNGCARLLGKDFSPKTKLIFMMRDPADRCYSAYKYFLALGFLPMSVVADDKKRGHAAAFDSYVRSVLFNPRRRKEIMKHRMKYLCFSQGNYAYCIQEYLRYFPRENMKFIFFEEFVRDEELVTKDILDFLHIPQDPEMTFNVKSNETNFRAASPFRSKIMYLLQGTYYTTFEFLNMKRFCPGFFRNFMAFYDWTMDQCTRPETDTSKMLPSTRKLLNRYYRNQIRQVEELAGRNVPERWARKDN